MENRLNFEAISDDELAKIVGGGYPNNQSMNDVLHWLNGHNDGNPKQLPKWMGGLARDKLSIEERKCFLIAKKNIESGRNFDPQISELISSLQYLAHSSDVQYFFSEAQKRMLVNPGTGGSLYGWSNFESK